MSLLKCQGKEKDKKGSKNDHPHFNQGLQPFHAKSIFLVGLIVLE